MPRVDLHHLLEKLRDAYDGSLEEAILTELTAAALDSGATRISVVTHAPARTLTIADDGRGMTRRDLTRQHRLAAGHGTRGRGIGSSGAGIRLGLLVADDVVTETRRSALHAATTIRLATRYRAPWEWIPPPGLTGARGTAVRLRLANPLSPLLDTGYIEEALRKHFAPLLEPECLDLLRRRYPDGIGLEVNGEPLTASGGTVRDRATIPIRLGRRRLPSAVLIMQRHHHPLPEDQQGIAISTLGRVVRRGWDWIGLSPASAWRVTGLVEAPELAAGLTPTGDDFVRTGPRAAGYTAHRKAIRDAVSRQLAAWGDAPDEEARPKTQRLDEDVARALESLAGEFPALRALLDPQAGDAATPLFADAGPGSEDDPPGPMRCGLTMQFESRPEAAAVGRLVDGSIRINEAHPAYVRAAASRAIPYHTALAAALAVAPHAVDPGGEAAFLTRFLEYWGQAPPRAARERK